MAQTREQVEALLAIEIDALEKQQAKVMRLRKLITNMATKDADNQPMTMALALETFLNDGRTDYEKGRNHLEQLSWKGAWKGTGLRYTGGYWPGSRQRVLQLALNYTWDTAKLAELEKLILSVIPDMKTGNYDTSRKGSKVTIGSWDKKATTVDGQTLKLFSIFEHDLSAGGDYTLGIQTDGSAIVFDQRRIEHGLIIKGTLAECLEHVRINFWYEGGQRDREEDDYCC